MAKKPPARQPKPTDSLPMGDGTEADDQAPPVEPEPKPETDPEDNGKPPARDRQSAAPYCPACATRMEARNSTPEVTRYYCPECGESLKKPRPNAPVCPYCKGLCTVTNAGPRKHVFCEHCGGYRVSAPRHTPAADEDYAAR